MGLAACDGNPDAVRYRNLGAVTIPGVQPGYFDGVVSLNVGFANLMERLEARGVSIRELEVLRMQIDGRTSNEALERRVDQDLGQGWQRRVDFHSVATQVKAMVWESVGKPKRFYALLAHERVQSDSQGRAFRPMVLLHSK